MHPFHFELCGRVWEVKKKIVDPYVSDKWLLTIYNVRIVAKSCKIICGQSLRIYKQEEQRNRFHSHTPKHCVFITWPLTPFKSSTTPLLHGNRKRDFLFLTCPPHHRIIKQKSLKILLRQCTFLGLRSFELFKNF